MEELTLREFVQNLETGFKRMAVSGQQGSVIQILERKSCSLCDSEFDSLPDVRITICPPCHRESSKDFVEV